MPDYYVILNPILPDGKISLEKEDEYAAGPFFDHDKAEGALVAAMQGGKFVGKIVTGKPL